MLLIGIVGRKGSGKSTISDYIRTHRQLKEISFSDPLKDAISTIFGIPYRSLIDQNLKEVEIPEWGLSPRKIMQKFGGGLREIHPDVGVRFTEHSIRRQITPYRHYPVDRFRGVVVPDVRYPNEVDMIHRNDGVIIKVVPFGGWPAQEYDEHPSERWETLDFDYQLCNHFGDYNITIQDLERILNDIDIEKRKD